MPRRTERFSGRLTVAAAGAVGALLLVAVPASAHIRVISPEAKPGAAATLQFRVPSEKAEATTIRVQVALPPGVRLTSVAPVAGWKEQTAAPAADGSIFLTWTAMAGHAIQPDDRQYFDVHVGPLPDRPAIDFPVVQTYSDGSTVNWNQKQTGSTDPPYPVPSLALAPTATPGPDAVAPDAKLSTPEPSATVTTPVPAVRAAAKAPASDGGLVWWSCALAGLLAVAGWVGWAVQYRSRRKGHTTS